MGISPKSVICRFFCHILIFCKRICSASNNCPYQRSSLGIAFCIQLITAHCQIDICKQHSCRICRGMKIILTIAPFRQHLYSRLQVFFGRQKILTHIVCVGMSNIKRVEGTQKAHFASHLISDRRLDGIRMFNFANQQRCLFNSQTAQRIGYHQAFFIICRCALLVSKHTRAVCLKGKKRSVLLICLSI